MSTFWKAVGVDAVVLLQVVAAAIEFLNIVAFAALDVVIEDEFVCEVFWTHLGTET